MCHEPTFQSSARHSNRYLCTQHSAGDATRTPEQKVTGGVGHLPAPSVVRRAPSVPPAKSLAWPVVRMCRAPVAHGSSASWALPSNGARRPSSDSPDRTRLFLSPVGQVVGAAPDVDSRCLRRRHTRGPRAARLLGLAQSGTNAPRGYRQRGAAPVWPHAAPPRHGAALAPSCGPGSGRSSAAWSRAPARSTFRPVAYQTNTSAFFFKKKRLRNTSRAPSGLEDPAGSLYSPSSPTFPPSHPLLAPIHSAP